MAYHLPREDIDPVIRRATREDVAVMAALQRAVEAEGALLGYVADTEDDWAGRDLGWTWVADRKGEAAGFVHATPRPFDGECVFPPDGRILELVELIVGAGHRDRGLGRALVTAVRERARAEGFTHLRVYSAARRFDDVLRFYRACGFTPWFLEMTQDVRDARA
jgi:GNAT superfamily N-acetyltransferase